VKVPSIPELLDNYLPDMRLLSMFLLRLAIQVYSSSLLHYYQA